MSFKITKDISPEKISGYTYQGMPIVIGKKRGRPPRTRAKPTWYSIEKKVHAACLYAVTGSLEQVSKLVDIPLNQLRTMMGEQWWVDTISQVRREENDQITAKMTTVIEKSLDAVIDRLENGDQVLNLKTGETSRVPVRFRDLSFPIGVLTDKRQLLRGDATSRTEKLGQEDILKELGNKFEAFAKKLGHKKLDIIDVVPEEINDGKTEETKT
jgi:hypothetical protein